MARECDSVALSDNSEESAAGSINVVLLVTPRGARLAG